MNQKKVFTLINEYKLTRVDDDIEEPENCILEITCESWGDDTVTGERVLVGKSSYILIDLFRDEVMHSWFPVLDSDGGLCEYLDLIGNGSSQISNFVSETILGGKFDPENIMEFFVIDRVEVLPEYRGNGYGKAVIIETLKKHAFTIPLVAIIPFPLQFSHYFEQDVTVWDLNLKLDELPKDKKLAFKKIEDYYASLGFKSVTSKVYAMENPYLLLDYY